MTNLFKFTFRFEVPRDSNLWVSVHAENEDDARVYAYNKASLSHSKPIEIKELAGLGTDTRPPETYSRVI